MKPINWHEELKPNGKVLYYKAVQVMHWDVMLSCHICDTVERYKGGTIYDFKLKDLCTYFRCQLMDLSHWGYGDNPRNRKTANKIKIKCRDTLDKIEQLSKQLSEY